MSSPEGDLPQMLHMAEMLMQLRGPAASYRASGIAGSGQAVPRNDQIESGSSWSRGFQPQVDQLAEVMSLEFADGARLCASAGGRPAQMAVVGEQIASEQLATDDDDPVYTELLSYTQELSVAMRNFLAGREKVSRASDQRIPSARLPR